MMCDETDRPKILIVDDIPGNIKILVEMLCSDFGLFAATCGEIALNIAQTKRPDLILLDIVMPGMDGYEVCRRLKMQQETADIPVIFTTANKTREDIIQGLAVGAHYYLTKPLDKDILWMVIRSVLTKQRLYRDLQKEIHHSTHTLLRFLYEAKFVIKTLDEVRELAVLLAKTTPDPERTVAGLQELLFNAVEHGNLGISYQEKSQLHATDQWEEEVQRRLELPKYVDRRVTVWFKRKAGENHFLIVDEGEGFEWEPFLKFDPKRMFDSHGRGIAMAANASLDSITYQGVGNQVLAVVKTED
ncbi:response regulator [Magnetococcales bacterium HHB-1]